MTKKSTAKKNASPDYVAPSWLAPGPDGKYAVNNSLTRLDEITVPS